MNFSAVILAGGKSSRMGRDKAWLAVGGQTLLASQIGLVRELGAAEIFISGRIDADYSTFDCRVLHDKFPDAGPLAGIERALQATASPLILVLAVDLPKMKGDFLLWLAALASEKQGVIPRVNGKLEPLAAIYLKAAQPLAELLLRDKLNAASNFAENCMRIGLARFVDLPASKAKHFVNLNSPADLAAQRLVNLRQKSELFFGDLLCSDLE